MDFEVLGMFNLKNSIEIKEFITKNPKFIDFFNDIKPLLYEYYPLREYFLEYHQDPEDPEWEVLFIKMKTESNDDNLDLVIDEWLEFSHKLREYGFKYDLWNKVVTDVF